MVLLEGKVLDRYTLGRLVGKGGMANVYEAEDQQYQRKVAIKIFKREDEEMLRRFIREASLMSSLRHEHLVPIIDSGQCQLDGDIRYYLVMPYLDGGTLRARIRRSPLSLQETCRIIHGIGGALDYIHSQGIIHRDIKASNVLLSAGDEYYLTDFGIARITNDATQLTSTGDVLGTVDYIAPELFESDRRADVHSDHYSLGVLLYEMVTGRLPFTAESQLVVVSMHMNKQPPSPRNFAPYISSQIEGVIYKALEKRPEQRYHSATELAAAFCSAVNTLNEKRGAELSQAQFQPVPTPTKSNSPKHSFLFAVVLALLALLIITVSMVIPRANNKSTGINRGAQHLTNARIQGATIIPTATPNLTATAMVAQEATATAHAQATATVIAGLTATVEAKASATAGVIQTATSGKPVYQDGLTSANSLNTVAANWDEDSKCAFAPGGYHVKEGTNWHICKESAYSYQDAAVTANLRILSGQTGGLLFRVNTDLFGEDSGYLFEMNNAGKFRIALFSQRFTATITPLKDWTFSAALRQGSIASNTLQVIVQGSNMSFYVNGVFLVQLIDPTYTSGMIAFYATTNGSIPADVVYSNLKVYPLT